MKIINGIVILVFCIIAAGCQTQKLPAMGDSVYCPSCESDLFLRAKGTSRTSFNKSDYIPLVFDAIIDISQDAKCPICNANLATVDADGMWHVSYHKWIP